MKIGATIVIDLGKTLSKVTLWDADGRLLDRQTRPNTPFLAGGLRRLDVEGIGGWLIEALSAHAGYPVQAIVPVGHAAAFAAIRNDNLAFPPLDYEQSIPDDVFETYRAQRDPFEVTGSPQLPAGLNLGAQIWWAERIHPEAMAEATLLPWAQYWAWFLSGKSVSEVTSLGCHSDLWEPASRDFSPMAQRLGWATRFAPLVLAGDTAGRLRPEIARATGLSADVRVLAGLHDSNAALHAAHGFAELADQDATVLSTGTWFIAMRRPGEVAESAVLPAGRDCLINVDVEGCPVPSARFMGGREIESVIGIDTRRVDIKPDQPALLAAVPGLLECGAMLLPTLAPGCGPFPDHGARWISEPTDWHARRAAMCLYAALVADAALDLIGSRGCLLVEGRFAEAEVFVHALAALRPQTQVLTANAHNDVSFGAIRLLNPDLRPQGDLTPVEPLSGDIQAYREQWRAAFEPHP
ncbi:carbohydrate kinase [Novosphingobium sp. AAP83]|uniref:FGGY-family carbohydrate kinase n=1 Tax=Novosphingobium sp. AAP83 TaxID=1523425 RepID=UPI0006B91DBC|nr:carbohydrate kinase [Novosphingobium sp. AAP83]KPF91866.1 carbohydrate kinase [Novosphingobium sp. AAP83]